MNNDNRSSIDAAQQRKIQRKLEADIPWIKIGLIAITLTLLLSITHVLAPLESTSVSSQSSNLIPSGLTGDKADAQSVLIEKLNDPKIGKIFGHFGITKSSIENTDLGQITPTEQYYAVTVKPTGLNAETIHIAQDEYFYDSPLDQLLTSPKRPLDVLIGQTESSGDSAKTGAEGRWFAIDTLSGNIIIKKLNQPQITARSFSSQNQIEAGSVADFYIEIVTENGHTTSQPSLSINIPEGTSVTNYQSDIDFTIATLEYGTLTLSTDDNVRLGGNTSYWTRLQLMTYGEAEADRTICLKPTLSSQVADETSKLVATKCLTVAPANTVQTNECRISISGEAVAIGDYKKMTDLDCLDKFENALFTGIDIDNIAKATYKARLTQINLGSDERNESIEVDIADALEYSTASELNGGTQDNDRGVISWPAAALNPLSDITRSLTLTLHENFADTPTTLTNSQSFDRNIQINFQSSSDSIQLDQSNKKIIENTSASLSTISPLSGLSITVFIAAIFTTIYISTAYKINQAATLRGAITGQIEEHNSQIESLLLSAGRVLNNGVVKYTTNSLTTLFPPLTITWMGVLSSVGGIWLFWIAYQTGFTLSGAENIVLLASGYFIGLMIGVISALTHKYL